MKKRIVSILLSLCILSLLIVGCGNKEGNDENTTKDSQAEQADGETAEVDWPTRSIEFVCSMSAGGDSDFNTRVMAKYLTEELDEPVVVTNITGAGGTIGTEEFINSDNDGYRFYLIHVSLHTAKAFGMTEYGWSDMDPVCAVGQGTGEFITVRSDFPADDMPGLIEETKKNPGKYRFGINPGATSNYIAVALQQAGADLNLVSTGSASDRVVGLKGDHLDIICAGLPNVQDYVETGEFKVLGNCSSERYPTIQDYPTIMEQGIDAAFDPVYVLYAVKGTDPAIIEKMSKACGDIINNNTSYQEEIETAYSQVPIYMDTDEVTEFLTKQEKIYMDISDALKDSYKSN